MRYAFFSALKLIALFIVMALAPASINAKEAGQQQVAGAETDPHAHHRAMLNKPADPATTTEVDLLDLVLIDQHGDEMKFVSDVIADRIVVMDFVYTTCTTVCPVISAVFGQMQKKLGDQLGDEVVLLSVSVDPVRDTPKRLKAYAARHNAKPGWIWLTGHKRTMDKVLDGLGAYSPNFEDHPAMVLVGDARSGEWSRFFGFPNPDRLMKQVNALQPARLAAARG